MAISTPAKEKQHFNKKKVFRNRYRWYSILVIFAIVPLLAADTFNFPQTVFTTGARYDINSFIAKKIEAKSFNPSEAIAALDQKSEKSQIIKITGQGVSVPEPDSMAKAPDLVIKQPDTNPTQNSTDKPTSNPPTNENQNPVTNPAPEAPRSKTLDEIVAKPDSPQFRSQLVYSKVKIKAPIIWSKLDDLYEKNSDGSINILKQIAEKEEDIKKGNYESTPIQKLLKDGVVHLADSVMPGEIGNSYVIGHSSNYRQVISNYNYVFATLTQSKIGDEFIIFDPDGRELKFKVFDVTVIDFTDVETAYFPKGIDGKRVVTLQASVLVNGKPLKRRLVRGELQV